MSLQSADLAFGANSEQNLTATLNGHFNTTLNRLGGFHIFDYIGEADGRTIEVELKTRRIRHDQYLTAIIGTNKIEYARANHIARDFYFVFCYSDGIYYTKYDPAVFAHLDTDDHYLRGARADCYNGEQRITHIPTSLLSPFGNGQN
jgi:hypothetical protein